METNYRNEKDRAFIELAQNRHKVNLSPLPKTDWKDTLTKATNDPRTFQGLKGEIEMDFMDINKGIELMKVHQAFLTSNVHKKLRLDWEEKTQLTKTREVTEIKKN